MMKKLIAFAGLFVAASLSAGCVAEAGDQGSDPVAESQEELSTCGGLLGLQCPSGFECVDDPRDSCDPNNGGADCIGVCKHAKTPTTCGGLLGLQCPKGYECVDDPSDSCDPNNGGADCGGVCKRAKPSHKRCDYRDTSDKYFVGTSTAECSTIRFICEPGFRYFADDCGCGCEFVGEPCGPNTCGAGEVCCNSSCGICTQPGEFCIQIACDTQ